MQALAASKLLRRFDYLSTVSGGGYIGSILGALFARESPAGIAAGAKATRPAAVERALPDLTGWLVRWLRENGRYLSPNGAGDTLLGGAVMLRNWIAVQLVLGTFALALFVGMDLVRAIAQKSLSAGFLTDGYVAHYLWWSPYVVFPIVVLVLWAVPAGWSYWLIPRPQSDGTRDWKDWLPVATALLLLTLQAAALGLLWYRDASPRLLAVQSVALVATVLTIGFFWVSFVGHGDSERARHDLSVWLKSGLVVAVALGVLALIDSLGQTLYVAAGEDGGVWRWLAPVVAAVGAAATVGQKLAGVIGMDRGDKRPRLPFAIVALVAAVLVAGVILVLIAMAGHRIAWMGELPGERRTMHGGVLGGTFALLMFLSWSFGRTRSFMNQSTMGPLYSARLRRAYLGASNPKREADPSLANVTADVDGDELKLKDYHPWERGGPLHIVNVTLNETVSGQSQTEQRDRKGLPMAFGPVGVSVGIRHHAWRSEKEDGAIVLEPVREDPRTPDAPVREDQRARFRIFDPEAGPPFVPERLTLSRLIAISGAAVSTGIGSRTSLGLSLLVGLLNIRLGHWWLSGVDPRKRGTGIYSWRRLTSSLGQAFSRTFSVQAHLLDELTARFHGPMRRNWYLTDSGHFENTGCYELLRRRIPMIVLIDSGEDSDYRFEDFAQLVRKARLDFGATMHEVSADELALVDESVRRRGVLGNLDEIRGEREGVGSDREGRRWNKAHAALVKVEYADTGQHSLVLWIKPTLTTAVPADVLHYSLEHLEFPQQSTGDQYFDEAQWESYRRLGQYIGEQLFGAGEETGRGGGGWRPRDLDPSLGRSSV